MANTRSDTIIQLHTKHRYSISDFRLLLHFFFNFSALISKITKFYSITFVKKTRNNKRYFIFFNEYRYQALANTAWWVFVVIWFSGESLASHGLSAHRSSLVVLKSSSICNITIVIIVVIPNL